jgi:acetyl-CoA carboxylase biotin carboxyl carrier protein
MADYKEITKLIKLISDSNLTEFKMKDGDLELSIRTDKYVKVKKEKYLATQQAVLPSQPQQMMQPQAPAPQPQTPAAPAANSGGSSASDPEGGDSSGDAEADNKDLVEIKSPIVGTFYRSSAPDKPPYAKVGDEVNVGDVVCIVEAMKLFNEIESEVSGKVVKVLVEDATPVEYDQALFLVDPKA